MTLETHLCSNDLIIRSCTILRTQCNDLGYPENYMNGTTCTIIDAATRGVFMRKMANEAYELLEEMEMNNY